MKRRSFLAALFAAPSAAVIAKEVVNPEKETSAPQPFVVDGQVVRLDAANIGAVTGGVIHWGGMTIDIDAGTVTIRS